MVNDILKDGQKKFETTLKHLQDELAVIRSSQVSPSLIEDIAVEAYGDTYTIKELGAISLQETSTLAVQVWDQSVMSSIEKALQNANLGASPSVDGDTVRLNIPPLSSERREEMIKRVGQVVEEARIAVRNIRQEKMKSIDALEQDGQIGEDEQERAKEDIQKTVDETNKKIEEMKDKKTSSLKQV